MFDYQAGEKYKLTLIMVGISGMLAGIFVTLLLMPTPEPARGRTRYHAAWMDNPDVTGRPKVSAAEGNNQLAQQAASAQPAQTQAPPGERADPNTALSLV